MRRYLRAVCIGLQIIFSIHSNSTLKTVCLINNMLVKEFREDDLNRKAPESCLPISLLFSAQKSFVDA